MTVASKEGIRAETPFRFDNVGSFLRPEKLKEARKAFAKGNISEQDLKAVEDEAIKDLIQKQKEIGLKAITDGEFRRSWWHLDFMWGLQGAKKSRILLKVINFKGKKQDQKRLV